MRTRRVGFVLFFVILAVVLLGSNVASARPAQTPTDPALVAPTPLTTPAGHTGRHCRTRPDPVAPDPADL
jgi:hypothetical protein